MGTLGRHLAHRLVEVGVDAVFGVPGDFNLLLLDEMIAEPRLRFIGCCNELNAGYAADGYARVKRVGACVVTFTVGSLSVINAIAGAYSENLPVICIVGGPNSNDYGSNRILHHTVGLPDFGQELRCFQQVTCTQDLENGQEMIDYAISSALKESKPVYISISCDIPAIHHPSFARAPIPYAISSRLSNPQSLEAAAEEAAKFLNSRTSPVLVAGPKLRVAKAQEELLELANQSDYAVAVMPSAKGQFLESHPHFIGTYWGAVSSPGCVQTVDEADGVVFVGPVFNDYGLIEYGTSAFKEKAIVVQPERVVICTGLTFGCVLMKDFLKLLSTKVQKNNHPFQKFERLRASARQPEPTAAPGPSLTVRVLYQHIQNMLTKDSAVLTDNGDSWFNTQNLKLPDGCGYEIQLQYGSIGWSVGALLGYAEAAKEKRVIAFMGDGSFQVTAQDVSTMLRCKQRSIIFLLNNGGYTIEVLMHDGPYNVIKNWDYTKVVESFHNGEGKLWTAKATTEAELVQAIEVAQPGARGDWPWVRPVDMNSVCFSYMSVFQICIFMVICCLDYGWTEESRAMGCGQYNKWDATMLYF